MTKQEKIDVLKERFYEIVDTVSYARISGLDSEVEDILTEISKQDLKLFFDLWSNLVVGYREQIKHDDDLAYDIARSPLVRIGFWCEEYIGDMKWWRDNYLFLLSNDEVNKIIYNEAAGALAGSELIIACIVDGNYKLLEKILNYVAKNEHRKKDFFEAYDKFCYVKAKKNNKKISDVIEAFIKKAPTDEAYKKCLTKFLKYQAVLDDEEETIEKYKKVEVSQEIYSGLEFDIYQTALEFNNEEFIVHISIETWGRDPYNICIDECVLDEDEIVDVDVAFKDDVDITFKIKRNIAEISSVGYQIYILNLETEEDIDIPNVVFEID